MDLDSLSSIRELYDNLVLISIIFVSCDFLLFTYLAARLSLHAKNRKWMWGLRSLAFLCFVTAIVRAYVAILYPEDYAVKLIIPITQIVSWVVVSIFAYAIYKFLERQMRKTQTHRAGIELMNEITQEVVEPVLQGREPAPHVMADLTAKHATLSRL